jgi:hypothetical protein
MKKALLGLLILFTCFLIGIYLFIPNKSNTIQEIYAKSTTGIFQRLLSNKQKRKEWLPKEVLKISDNEYELNGCKFNFYQDNSYNQNINFNTQGTPINSILTAIDIKDSVVLSWAITAINGSNPIKRVSNYLTFRKIKHAARILLYCMTEYLKEKKNIYGIAIEKIILKDSTLISLKATTKGYPTIADIYKNIKVLEQYANEKGATITNAPMLNIVKNDSLNWDFMVAIPINKDLPNNGSIIAKRMFSGGKILETENIKGGFYTVDKCIKELENYKSDNNFLSPAIPFQSLITNRQKEADSSKWVTKLYYPIF